MRSLPEAPEASLRLPLTIAILLGLLLGAVSLASAETLLRARLNSDIISTDPGVLRDENTDAVLMHVVEGLVAYREDTHVGPLLASTWDVSQDGRSYTFHLRHHVIFHNGAPMTAASVVWSFHRYLDPATHWRCQRELTGGGLAKILSVQALDRFTVRVVLDKSDPGFLRTLARTDCGETAILDPSSVAPDGEWRWPIGTGPFKLAAWKRNQYIELTRFARYRSLPGPRDGETGSKHALVDAIRFEVIPDSAAAEAALLRGSLDVLDGLLPIETRFLGKRADVHLDVQPTMDVYALLFQTRDPLLKDPRLRRAIALTLDVPGLARAVSQGTAQANRSIVPAISPFHDVVQAQIPAPNLVAARRLLLEAGYHGQPIRLIANRRYPLMFNAAVLIQAMALEAGINIQIETLDWAAQLDKFNHGDYQAMSLAYSARLDPSLSYEDFLGDKTVDPRRVWDDTTARALLAQSLTADDFVTRQRIFDRLQELLLQQVPAVVLFNSADVTAVRANVVGFKGWPGAEQRLWGVSFQ